MIDCMYGRSFILIDHVQLDYITNVADFERAGPVLSRTLDAVLLRSPLLVNQIPDHASHLPKIAYQLRALTLYKECMIHIAGRWEKDPCIAEEDTNLRIRVLAAYGNICGKLNTTHQGLWRILAKFSTSDSLFYQTRMMGKQFTSLAPNYWELCDEKSNFGIHKAQTPLMMQAVMRNNLVLDNSQEGSGQGRYKYYFLCAEIADKERPWGLGEEDW